MNNNIRNNKYSERITAFNQALGSHKEELTFGKENSCFGVLDCLEETLNEAEIAKVIPLDEENLLVKGNLVIKMDVEGFELEVLKGAQSYIKKYRPYMAVCVYHRIEDIYVIPRFLLSIGVNYTFLLRSGVHTHLIAIPK